ncbi:MAG: hypothetical protein NC920_04380, partial [Candidatus Omnitrophica bacterium]|nr:hypothetical protein [Candidatus Omnitrophota bacterium]
PAYVREIVLEVDEVLDIPLKNFLVTKAKELVEEFYGGRLNIEEVEESVKRIVNEPIVEEKILFLTQEEIERRKNFEEVNDREEKDLYFWMRKIVYSLASRELVSWMVVEIEDLLHQVNPTEQSSLRNLKERLIDKFLGIHYGGGEGLISDRFYKAIKLSTEYGDLIPQTFSSLLNIQGINNQDVISVWLKIPGETIVPDHSRATYQYRVTVKKREKIISAEFVLKISFEEEKREALKKILSEFKKYSLDFPEINSPGSWIENFVWENSKPKYFLAFTQKSLFRDYIKSLKELQKGILGKTSLLVSLETEILTTALKFWKETRENGKGLLVFLSPGAISVFNKRDKWEHRFVGIENSSWLSWEEVLGEMRRYGYSPEAMVRAIENSGG